MVHLPTIHGRLPSKPIYIMAVLYLTLHSLVSAIFSLIRNFAPIPMYGENETTRIIPTTVLSDITNKIYNTYIRYMPFFFFGNQHGIEQGHPRTLYPDDVIRNTIGHMGHPIYVVNEVLFIYHSILTLHIYAIYKIYKMHIRYIQYI